MKNDFDFIKDKIEQSGVNAPDTMDENYVLQQLEGIEPDTTAPVLTELKPKKRRYGVITGIAAAFVAVVTLSVFGAIRFGNHQGGVKPSVRSVSTVNADSSFITPQIDSSVPLKTFKSYDELKEQIIEVSDKYKLYSNRYLPGWYGAEDMAVNEKTAGADSFSDGLFGSGSSSTGSSGNSSDSAYSSDSFSETYKQVEGVDEADVVKTDGRYLYIVSCSNDNDCIRIYSATDDPELVVTVYPQSMDKPAATPDEVSDDYNPNTFIEEIFLHDSKLIVTGLTRSDSFEYDTMALVYDISDVKHIKLLNQFHQSGYYNTSRMIGDTLYMISDSSIYADDFKYNLPVCYGGSVEQKIPVDCIYSVKEPTNNDILVVGGFNVADGSDEIRTTALVGSVEDVYCNENNLYIYAQERNTYYLAYNYGIYERDENDSDIVPPFEPQKTSIYKVSLKGGISFTACGTVEGTLDSRYSLDEKDGYLRVAATTEDKFWHESNRLYVLDSDLKEVGRVEDFAKNESIRAVRYVGDTAYVITYERTDPLFVIDVSDPKNPSILGEVKIDGFSTMLVPVDDNTVLGLGVYTEEVDYIDMPVQHGFKLALFDVSDKLNPKVLDEKSYPDYYSSVVNEPRALVYNSDRGDYLIPLNYENYHLDSDVDYYMPDIIGGALNFKVEGGRLVEIDHPTVNIDNSDADTIGRCLYVGDNIYMISEGYYSDADVYTAKYK